MSARISVVVNTLNEEARLPFALRSVRSWADEMVVVDMHSDDRTAEVAREHGAQVFLHPRTEVVEPARAFAISRCTGDWVLILDADEMVPEPLSRALRAIAARPEVEGARVPRLNYLFGAPLLHADWSPRVDRPVRFFRPGALAPLDRIHAQLRGAEGRAIVDLDDRPDHAIVHFNYTDVAQFVERMNRYTTVEAREAHARGERASRLGAIGFAAKDALGRYLRRGARRDGWRGAVITVMMLCYRLTVTAKLRELEAGQSGAAVAARYREVADQLLRGYDTASR